MTALAQHRNKEHRAPMVRMASGARVASYSIADPEVADRLEKVRQKLSNKAEAIAFLQYVGILDATGELAEEFGGKSR